MKYFLAIVLFCVVAPFGVWKWYRYAHPVYRSLPPREEKTITIIPGWDLRDIANYFVQNNVVSSTQAWYDVVGRPAFDYTNVKTRPFDISLLEKYFPDSSSFGVSYEGYLSPETYRIYADASIRDVAEKLLAQRRKELSLLNDMVAASGHSWHTILTMGSIVEREARSALDRQMIADILWRRVKRGWALQVDSSVHYIVDKSGSIYTTDKERQIDSPWNTYRYPGLPPGPISTPSLESIKAALYPKKNEYWYFLSGDDGKMHYAKTLEEHNANRVKYLR